MAAAIGFLKHRGYHELEDHAFPHTSLTLYLYGLWNCRRGCLRSPAASFGILDGKEVATMHITGMTVGPGSHPAFREGLRSSFR